SEVTMDHELEEFLAWLTEQRKRTASQGVRYPSERRAWAVEYARRRMAAGASSGEVQKELTVSDPALRRWLAPTNVPEKTAAPRLRVVTVKEEPAPAPQRETRPLTLITPHGFRIEGLDATSVLVLLRELR